MSKIDSEIVAAMTAKQASAPVKIVVLQRGWVVVGKFNVVSEVEHELIDASVIRYWGTTQGLGELRTGPTKATKLDPCGRVTFHPMTVVLKLDVEEGAWS